MRGAEYQLMITGRIAGDTYSNVQGSVVYVEDRMALDLNVRHLANPGVVR